MIWVLVGSYPKGMLHGFCCSCFQRSLGTLDGDMYSDSVELWKPVYLLQLPCECLVNVGLVSESGWLVNVGLVCESGFTCLFTFIYPC